MPLILAGSQDSGFIRYVINDPPAMAGFDPEPVLPQLDARLAVDGERASWADATISPQRCPLSALPLEIFVEVVEDLGASCNPFRVVLGRDADAFDQRPNARDFGAAELAVLEIDVMDDFCDGA